MMDEKYFTAKSFELSDLLDKPMKFPMAELRLFLKQIASDAAKEQHNADVDTIEAETTNQRIIDTIRAARSEGKGE